MQNKDIQFLRLLMRSPDLGDGWREVSSVCWPLVEAFPHKELIETRDNAVRLSDKGQTVVDYM